MSTPTQWVADVSGDLVVFYPIDGDFDGEFCLIVGMAFVSDEPPPDGRLVGIVHPDGQEAVEEWCRDNHALVERWRRLARRHYE